jgi:hypothetical protein
MPHDENEEELTLAPIDESEETRYRQLMRETYNIQQNILGETDVPDDPSPPLASEYNERQLIKDIIYYLRQMADGELDQAERTSIKIKPFKKQAQELLIKMTRTERPEPELADIAPTVLKGLVKNLLAQL